jgi:hypothetical protein
MFENIQYVYLLKNIYKMGCLGGSSVPVLHIGRTVPKGELIKTGWTFSKLNLKM